VIRTSILSSVAAERANVGHPLDATVERNVVWSLRELRDTEVPFIWTTSVVGDTHEAGTAHKEVDAFHPAALLLLV